MQKRIDIRNTRTKQIDLLTHLNRCQSSNNYVHDIKNFKNALALVRFLRKLLNKLDQNAYPNQNQNFYNFVQNDDGIDNNDALHIKLTNGRVSTTTAHTKPNLYINPIHKVDSVEQNNSTDDSDENEDTEEQNDKQIIGEIENLVFKLLDQINQLTYYKGFYFKVIQCKTQLVKMITMTYNNITQNLDNKQKNWQPFEDIYRIYINQVV